MSAAAPILLIGAGGHAAACIDVIEQDGRFTVAGVVGTKEEVGQRVLGYPVLGTDEDLPALVGRYQNVLISIGQIKTPTPRIRLFERLQQIGCTMPVIVSPRAYVSPRASIGAGTIVMHGVTVNVAASIGRNCILNSMCLVEHGAAIADHCHLATAAVVNGGAAVGSGTFLGSHCTIRQGIRIGERCIIGMGEKVSHDCEPGARLPAQRSFN